MPPAWGLPVSGRNGLWRRRFNGYGVDGVVYVSPEIPGDGAGLHVALRIGGLCHQQIMAGRGNLPAQLPLPPGVTRRVAKQDGFRPGQAAVDAYFDLDNLSFPAPSKPPDSTDRALDDLAVPGPCDQGLDLYVSNRLSFQRVFPPLVNHHVPPLLEESIKRLVRDVDAGEPLDRRRANPASVAVSTQRT